MTNTTLAIKMIVFMLIFNGLFLSIYTMYTAGAAAATLEQDNLDMLNEVPYANEKIVNSKEPTDLSSNNKLSDQTAGNAYTITSALWNLVTNFNLVSIWTHISGETMLENQLFGFFSVFAGIINILSLFVIIQAFKKS